MINRALGKYVNTTFAYHGMKGTDLPELPTGTVWTAGGQAEVTWQVKFNVRLFALQRCIWHNK